jgi:hypothetical protein
MSQGKTFFHFSGLTTLFTRWLEPNDYPPSICRALLASRCTPGLQGENRILDGSKIMNVYLYGQGFHLCLDHSGLTWLLNFKTIE